MATRPCRKSLSDTIGEERMRVLSSDANCIPDYAQACPNRYTLEGSTCVAPPEFSGPCGVALLSDYNATEKAAYAEACLTPWSVILSTLL